MDSPVGATLFYPGRLKSQAEGISRSDAVAWVKASGESAVSTMVHFSTAQPTVRRLACFPGRETPRLPSLYSKCWKAVRNWVFNAVEPHWGVSRQAAADVTS